MAKKRKRNGKNDRSNNRVKENNTEFRKAMKAGQLIRYASRHLIAKASLPSLSKINRMQSVLMRIIKTDGISDRGSREVSKGDLSLFRGFDIN
ncbi:MAG: hypothetical protein J7578_22790, partial [Chitinophagaceae bacterium]|nr:hypothetical protein [Chitinophagaceae bacterium]